MLLLRIPPGGLSSGQPSRAVRRCDCGTLERKARQQLERRQEAQYRVRGKCYVAAAANPPEAGRRDRLDLHGRSCAVRHVLHTPGAADQKNPTHKGTGCMARGATLLGRQRRPSRSDVTVATRPGLGCLLHPDGSALSSAPADRRSPTITGSLRSPLGLLLRFDACIEPKCSRNITRLSNERPAPPEDPPGLAPGSTSRLHSACSSQPHAASTIALAVPALAYERARSELSVEIGSLWRHSRLRGADTPETTPATLESSVKLAHD